jgi:hypothetical protein
MYFLLPNLFAIVRISDTLGYVCSGKQLSFSLSFWDAIIGRLLILSPSIPPPPPPSSHWSSWLPTKVSL